MRSHPARVQANNRLKQMFPYAIHVAEPPPLSETEWQNQLGRRFDGLKEKNEVSVHKYGQDYPMKTEQKETFTDFERQTYSVEAIKLQEKKENSLKLKHKAMKDTIQNMIYEMKHRELDTISKMQQ